MNDLILAKMREGDWGAVVRLMREEEAAKNPQTEERPRSFSERFVSTSVTPRQIAEGVVEDGRGRFKAIRIEGVEYTPSARFSKGLAQRMRVPLTVFELFPPIEVVRRAAEVVPDMRLRITVDEEEKKALGLIEDKGHPIPAGAVESIMKNDPRLRKFSYHDGVIEGMFDLGEKWEIANDSEYGLRLQTVVPVDGMGTPEGNLGHMRQVCSNGAVVFSPQFRTRMEVKDNSGAHFQRLLQSFSNPGGVEMLHERLLAAIDTKASVGEVYAVDEFLRKQIRAADDSMRVRERLQEVAGNPCVRYGVTDIGTIGQKRRSLLPVDCSVADLMNFVTELSSHHAAIMKNGEATNVLIGRFYASGYDLEEMYPNAQPSPAFVLKGLKLNEHVNR